MNNPPKIKMPRYKNPKWAHNHSYEYLSLARDTILTAFDWANTKEGPDYWEEVYTKIYIMAEHAKIYQTLRKLNNGVPT